MDFLKRWFGTETTEQPKVRFGRYSDIYKTREQDEAHRKAETAYKQGRYLDMFRYFLQYLYDPHEDNVHWREAEGKLFFNLVQGSRQINGVVTMDRFYADTKIARADVNNVGFLRRLIEQNYGLKYSRYALDEDNTILMISDSYLVDASPLKLYQCLQELAVMSDRLDDLLLEEFKNLEAVGQSTFTDISVPEKEVKYVFLISKIEETFQIMDEARPNKDAVVGGYAFLLLALLFKLDYLLRPEGYTMEALALMYGAYFAKDNKSTERKVMDLRQGFKDLKNRKKTDFFKELYTVNSTFGFTKPMDHHAVVREIENVLNNMNWYRDNGHEALALAIPEYTLGYCQYNFALPKPDLDFIHLYYQIFEQPFFEELGFDLDFQEKGKFNKRTILKAIRKIADSHQAAFPRLKPNARNLDFSNKMAFAQSYLNMIKDLNLEKTD